MFKNILKTVLLFFSFVLNAQNNEGTPVVGAKQITRNIFTQQQNFESTTERTSAATMSAPTGTSTEVGVTEGQLSVSLSGAATYSIPIAVPPGINGVQPNLSLEYNSQGGNGIVGYGWSIKGISTISRIASTKYHDGTIDPVDLDSSDRFALDGQRLIAKNGGIYGANGTEYETENYSNIKITSYTGTHPTGTIYFVVQYPDGSIAEYGNAFLTATYTDWYINYWQNPQGLRINYNYNPSSFTHAGYKPEHASINSITYGNLLSSNPINKITFNYSSRTDQEITYMNTVSFNRSYILNSINVKGAGDIGYKNYFFNYDSSSIGYNRLIKITEKNGDNSKSLNPTVFTYDTTPSTITYNGLSNSDITLGEVNFTNSNNVTGDFDGDGKTDFAMYATTGVNTKNKFWLFKNIQGGTTSYGWEVPTGPFEELIPTTWLGWANTLMPYHGITAIQNDASILGKVNFNVITDLGYSISTQYSKSVNFPTTTISTGCDVNCDEAQMQVIIPKQYLGGDFNGDGLTDIIAINKKLTSTSCNLTNDGWGNDICNTYTSDVYSSQAYFIDLDRFKTTNFMNNAGNLLNSILSTDKLLTADVNGDGKTDVLHFSGSIVKAYTLNDSNQLVYLMTNDATTYNFSTTPIYIGDYNGDGKTDFCVTNGSGSIATFFSTGSKFAIRTVTGNPTLPTSTSTNNYMFIPSDINNDGKTDLMRITLMRNSTVGSIKIEGFVSKVIASSFYFTSSGSVTTPNLASIKKYPVPIFLSSNKSNMDLSLNFISNSTIYNFKFNKDFGVDKLLKKITLGNGLEEIITYSPLKRKACIPYCIGLPFYKDSGYTENYPNYDIILAPNFNLVSSITKNGLQQDYGYYGAVGNTHGLGFLGFRSIAKTNFYNSSIPTITSFSHFNPSLRGLKIDEYTITGTPYQLNFNPTDYISKSVYTYNTYDNVNIEPFYTGLVFKPKNTISESFNGLDGTSSSTTTTFDNYLNPKTITSSIKEGASTKKTDVIEMDYDNASTTNIDYHIGRITNKKQTTTLISNSHIMKNEEHFNYGTGSNTSLVTQSISFVDDDNTKSITENNSYDTYGNLIEKVINPSGLAPRRMAKYEYSSTYGGRFLTKSTDIENLVTEYTYDSVSGNVLTEKSPYSTSSTPMINSYTYDSWHKKTGESYFDGKATTYTYTISGTDYILGLTGNDGSESKIYFDQRGRDYKKGIKNINDVWTFTQTEYDDIDRPIKEYEPFYTNLGLFNEIKYDNLGRINQTITSNNKTTNITYTGLSTLVDDNIKPITTVKNATGTIASVTDSDGTISYDYFANNNLKKTITDGIETIIEQDGWGRKTKMIDVSAGTIDYEYNLFGEIKKEINQNGTTDYYYDNFGKLTAKYTLGQNTNSYFMYEYYWDSKLINTIDVIDTEGNDHVTLYTYDNFKRLSSKYESDSTTQFEFEKQYTYDSLGRIYKEYNKAINLSDNKNSSKWIQNIYKNGYNWQILDDTSGKILWQANSVNEKGQLTNVSMGNGSIENVMSISNTFDQYGFPTQIKYDKTTTATNVATLNFAFNAQKANLDSRSNSMFNWNETFQYDNLDRLKEYTNEKGLQEVQVYDNKGRIESNDIGTYNYNKPNNNYQNTSIELSSEAKAYYNLKEGIFFDTMETKNGWSITDPNVFSFDSTVSNSTTGGITSIKINNNLTTEKVIHSEKWIPINNTVPTQYTYSAWVKSDGSNPQAQIFLFMKTETETGYFTLVDQKVSTTSNNWTLIEKTFLVPANIKKLNIRLDNNGYGILWFDNVKVRRTDIPSITSDSEKRLNITYNTFKSPTEIIEPGNERINFSYNAGNGRSIMYYGGIQPDKNLRPLRKYYSEDGSMEIKRNIQTGEVEFITYIGGDGYSAPMALKSNGTTQEYVFLVRDYQGSIMAITNQDGNVVEKRLYDAWGNIIKVQDGAGNSLTKMMVLDRGYTGHEHLQGINIIHMNGRLYDPKLHRFLQPDNNLQDPYNTQNYNRYSYVLNNPLKYIDPSGESGENNYGPPTDQPGFSSTEQSAIGSAIATIAANWDNWRIKDWANRNIGLRQFGDAAKSTGNFISRNIKSFGDDISNFFKGLFGGRKSSSPAPIAQMQLNGPSPNIASNDTSNYFGSNNSTYVPTADIHPPTQHHFAGINMTALSEGNFIQQTLYGMANQVNIVGQYLMLRSVGDGSMRNLNGTGTTTGEAALSFGTIPLYFAGGGALSNGSKSILSGGKTFAQYRSAYWLNRVKPALDPIINRETGQIWKQHMELHHRFIPQRWNWPNWITNNRFNLQEVNSLEHALRDPYRARFAPKWVKELYNLIWK